MTDLEDLKRLARAVPKKDGVDVVSQGGDAQHVQAVGAFTRAVKPNVVLALIERVERVECLLKTEEKERIRCRDGWRQSAADARKHFDQGCTNLRRAEEAEADNAALRQVMSGIAEQVRLNDEVHRLPGTGLMAVGVTAERGRALLAAFDSPSPGAALLERVSKLEASMRQALQNMRTQDWTAAREEIAHAMEDK